MLDQNTDRMWFVIGAVIVGAAIILLANTLFPAMFDTIGKTFTDKVDDMKSIIDPITTGKNTAGFINPFF